MMSNCERYELALSTLSDGELEAEEVLLALDHLAACPSCRGFWQSLRALDERIQESLLPSTLAPAPREVWRRIARSGFGATVRPAASWRRWAYRAAAIVAAGILAFWALQFAGRPGQEGSEHEIALSSQAATMSEKRVVEIAEELLRADPRYREQLIAVIDAVGEAMTPREGAAESSTPLAEQRRGGSSEDEEELGREGGFSWNKLTF